MKRPLPGTRVYLCYVKYLEGFIVKVEILGTGTATPSLKRLSSSYLVSTSWGNILVDIGPSVVRRLLEFDHTLNDIDMICLTHFHPDHTVDLPTFLFACNYGETERRKPLRLLGGKGLRLLYRRMISIYPWIVPIKYDLTVTTTTKNVLRLGGVSVCTDSMKHRDESIGIRIEDGGKTAVFSGDTEYTPALVGLASQADLLVVECSNPEEKVEGHMNLPAILPLIREARPRRVILSHLYASWEGFSGALPAPLMLGEDGLVVDL